MANLQFYLSRKMVGNRAEVYVRFYASHINQRAKTHIFVPVALWDEEQGRCRISHRYQTADTAIARNAQNALDELAQRILQAYADNPLSVSPKWLQMVIAPTPTEIPLYKYIGAYCESRDCAPATIRKMNVLMHHLQRYGAAHGDVYMSNLNTHKLDQIAGYFRTECKHSRNSISCRLKQLRTLVYWIGKPNPNPFDNYTIPTATYGTPIYLTKEERDYLYAFKDLSAKKMIQRDIFIFQCHTGCRVSDLYHLTANNIRDGWLVYMPRKTSRSQHATIEVPLTPTALQIIDRYRGCDVHGRLLPFISTQKYNQAIRDIAKDAYLVRPVIVLNPQTYESTAVPLWSVLTSHTARKTFTQIAYESTGDKRLVASMTGHSENSDAFNRYSEVTRDIKTKVLSSIE